jgi:hypothetical protein
MALLQGSKRAVGKEVAGLSMAMGDLSMGRNLAHHPLFYLNVLVHYGLLL